MNTETVLKDALADEADALGALDNPWPGFERRERKHRRNRRLRVAGVAAVLAAAIGVQAGVLPLPAFVPGIAVAGFDPVLGDDPVRGSLAGDKAFLDGMRREIKDIEDPGETWRVADRKKIKFVFASDFGDQRLVLALVPLRFGFLEDRALVWYSGDAGAAPEAMMEGSREDGGTVVSTYSNRSSDRRGVLAVVAPTDTHISMREGVRYTPEGRLEWGPERADADGGLMIGSMSATPIPPTTRIVVTRGADVLYEGGAGGGWSGNTGTNPQEVPSSLITQALAGREFDHETMRRWVESAIQDARLTTEGTTVRVRWVGTVNGQPSAMFTLQPRGGGVLAYAFHGAADSYRQDLRLLLPAQGAAERPIAWRMRAEGKDDRTDQVVVTAPDAATRVTLTVGGGAPVNVTPGATTTVPPYAEAHVTAYGENGVELGTTPVPPFETDSGGPPGDTPRTRVVG
ncbi:hypothetical protein KOI35_25175 [Actinoplanes bogorensis]|uniref:DUF4179 domain-containing protein n=1 Tax=Paractinoplanes bogorensis TaxID=1610840 RepID=A0ABS5YTM3_9ACTN|nr:hypothetical protein [Actinoplanes bogorensis]MBU2666807.1 hypothetical protein [Actinoplanes bogorensis]